MPATLLQDLRYALRSLRRSPGFAIAAVLTLAVGIGANTAAFSLVDAVILRTLPVRSPDQLFVVRETDPLTPSATDADLRRLLRFSHPRYQLLAGALPSGAQLAAMTLVTRLAVRVTPAAEVAMTPGQLVSGNYFDTFGARPSAGRLLSDADNRVIDGHPVAVVSERYWHQHFPDSAAPDGEQLVVNGRAMTIVGVVGLPFTGPFADEPVDVWVPLAMQHALQYRGSVSTNDDSELDLPWLPQDDVSWLRLMARLPGEPAAARAALAVANHSALQTIAARIGNASARERLLKHGIALDPVASGFSRLREDYSTALIVLTVIVALVLLIATVNLANLQLARAAARQREFAVRLSLGATRARLIGQAATENLLLAIAGGVAGLFGGIWLARGAVRLIPDAPADLIGAAAALQPSVLAFTAIVSLVAVLIFGILPAVRATTAAAATAGRTPGLTRATRGMAPLVAAQIALSMIVVVTAVLLGRTLANLAGAEPGFDSSHVVVVAFDPLLSGYAPEDIPALQDRVVGELSAVPGVSGVSPSLIGLLSGAQWVTSFRFEGYHPARDEPVDVQANMVGAGYFTTTGMTFADGRQFTAADMTTDAPIAIVNEALARRYFAGRRAVGRRLGEDDLNIAIVGVVRDAHVKGMRVDPMPTVYLPLAGRPLARSLEVRVAGDAAAMTATIRRALARFEPGLALTEIVPVEERLGRSVARERQIAIVSLAFGGIAVALACIGLYGVLSYLVVRRTAEIGVRLAIGATPRRVLALVLGQASRVIAVGTLLGAAGAFASRRLVAGLLFHVDAADPWSYATVAAALAGVALIASWRPARRAARIDPMVALRAE